MSHPIKKRGAQEVILGEDEDKRTRGCGEEGGKESEDDYQISDTRTLPFLKQNGTCEFASRRKSKKKKKKKRSYECFICKNVVKKFTRAKAESRKIFLAILLLNYTALQGFI